MEIADRLLRAKAGIILNHKTAFYAGLMMQKPMVADTTIERACTNGQSIKYNPDYFGTLPIGQIQGIIIHELMHIYMLHHTRRNGRDVDVWNKACDYVINLILRDAQIELPDDVFYDEQYRNMTAEQVYAKLSQQPKPPQPKQQPKTSDSGQGSGQQGNQSQGQGSPNAGQQNQPQPQPDPYGIGGVEDAPATSQSEIAEIEAEAKQQLAQAMTVAKQMGTLPGGMERLIEKILEPVVDWKDALARFMSDVQHNDYSFSKPNMRYAASGFILPSLYNVEMGEMVLIGDTSISMDRELLDMIAAEMQDIASSFNSKITAIWVDTKVQGTDVIEPDDVCKLNPKGGGGTDFRPAFPYMEKHDITPRAIVYFTDGYCDKFPEEPDAPVLWAVYNNDDFKPPFGEVIRIDL